MGQANSLFRDPTLTSRMLGMPVGRTLVPSSAHRDRVPKVDTQGKVLKEAELWKVTD